MKPFLHHKIFFLLFCIICSSCTEQYVLQSNNYDEALVVEATITNEFKHQEIKISRTFRFEDDGPNLEVGAQVYITDSQDNKYEFEENNGKYISATEFKAVQGNVYRLTIKTDDGRTYESSTETLTTSKEIQSIIPTVQSKNNEKGVSIIVNSFDPDNTSKYYRYEYEETYKIIAPSWNPFKAITIPKTPHDSIDIVLRDNSEIKTCYSTVVSNDIIATTTVGFSADRVNFPVRFISNSNPIIAHRYSILVRQYVQNLAGYTFYKTLKDLSGSESILSQNQPGFFYGNLKSVDNPNEKVIGFFEVSSVSSKRIFFNYSDLFTNETEPPYFVDCESQKFKFCFIAADPECRGAILLSLISSNSLLYLSQENNLYYYMALPPCVDCTKISSNIKPSFWID